jgi:hypothetical protein
MQKRSDELQLRQEIIAHQRRQLLHASIPDLSVIQELFGNKFDELRQLVIQYDPAWLGQDATISPLYSELTRTLLFQLHRPVTCAQLLSLVQQEVSLWFGRQYSTSKRVEELMIAIANWHQPRLVIP